MKPTPSVLFSTVLLLISQTYPCLSSISYETFNSPPVTLIPGGVHLKYLPMQWVSGHVSIRSFNAEMVDSQGSPVPLTDLYLHHWIVVRTFIRADADVASLDSSEIIVLPNSGTCENQALNQWFGVGSETRHTNLTFPEPFGIEVGNPNKIPTGFREAWFVQIHAIDTRSALNPTHCLECRCAAYNATTTEHGKKIPEGYLGGLLCCHGGVRCAVQPGADSPKTYFLRYRIGYEPHRSGIVPLRVYILDVTDNGKPAADSPDNSCQVEYQVDSCESSARGSTPCTHLKTQSITFPSAGRLVLSVGHLHAAGVSVSLLRQDGTLICESLPRYGRGSEAGDEAGYVTGMGICEHGRAERVTAGEKLTVRSMYSSDELHTGVMGLMYMAVAADEDEYNSSLFGKHHRGVPTSAVMMVTVAAVLLLFGIIAIAVLRGSRGEVSGGEYKAVITSGV